MKGQAHSIVHKMKMSPQVAAFTASKPMVALKLPYAFPPGDRIYMVEYPGAPTGRADLCTVIGRDGDKLILERRWCWRRGKFDDDLSQFKLVVQVDSYPVVGAEAIE